MRPYIFVSRLWTGYEWFHITWIWILTHQRATTVGPIDTIDYGDKSDYGDRGKRDLI